jgi:hypothetical protein
MTAQAPVCHIPPVTETNQPGPLNIPSIPPAQPTVQSLTATVNAMREVIMYLTGQRGQAGANGAAGAKSSPAPAGSWTQKQIVTEVVRVYNPNDNTQYVDVERVNKLVMGNDATKQLWTFQRPGTPSGG